MKGIKILGMQTEIVVISGGASNMRPSDSCLHNLMWNSFKFYPTVCMNMCKLRRCVLVFIYKNTLCMEVNKWAHDIMARYV